VRNLKLLISLDAEISPFGRNDNNGDFDTVSEKGETTMGSALPAEIIYLNFPPFEV